MSDSYVQEIHWVSGQDKKAKRNARGHLMRELLRKKQWAKENSEELPIQPVDDRSLTTVHTPWTDTKGKEKVLVLPSEYSAPAGQHGTETAASSDYNESWDGASFDLTTSHIWDSTNQSESSRSSLGSPISTLQSNCDPFNSLPTIPANATLSQVIFNGITFKTTCASIWNLKDNASFNPLRDVIYPSSSQDPAAFAGMVTMVASVQAGHRRQPVGPEAHSSKLYSIRAITERIGQSSSQALSDGTLVAVFGLCMVEASFGDQQACDTHSKGLHHMITLRGGLDKLPWLMQLLFCVASTLSFPITLALPSMSMSSNPKYSQAEKTERNMAMRTEELIEFMRDVEHCMKSPLSALRKRSETYKSRMFLHRTIARSSAKRKGHEASLRFGNLCRFAALAYIHMMILDYQNSPSALRRELDQMVEQLRGHRVQAGVTSDLIVWLLNQPPESLRLRDPQRSWKLNRFASIAKSLTSSAVSDLVGYLFDALEGKTSRSGALHDFWQQSHIWDDA